MASQVNFTADDVSVVIPTVGRPELRDAIQSVLDQTNCPREILVCADTTGHLDVPTDCRVKVARLGPGAGGNAARQLGVALASGQLIALLDDDDVWRRDKLAMQLDAASMLGNQDGPWLLSNCVEARFSTGRVEVWPSRVIDPGEPVSDFLFRKHRVFGGQGFLQASTFLFPKSIALGCPFDDSLRYHQDIDWLIQLSSLNPNLRIRQLAEPLTIYTPSAGGVSAKISPRQSSAWGDRRLADASARTRGDFYLTSPVVLARRQGSPSEVLRSVIRGLRVGRPGAPAMIYSLASIVLSLPRWLQLASFRRGI